jgi:peptidoglycan/xylan/chitin deacetylase (PgdA/CDA1 family)
MTRAELSDLIRGDHIEIGAHTVSHVQLSAISKERQIEEIKNSKQALQEITGAPVTSFSYPYGERNHYTQETIDIVKRDRFLCACSNFEEVVTRTTDPFQIPRFVVRNWDRGEFAAKLDDWFTQPRE